MFHDRWASFIIGRYLQKLDDKCMHPNKTLELAHLLQWGLYNKRKKCNITLCIMDKYKIFLGFKNLLLAHLL